jgi:hypothetical protein
MKKIIIYFSLFINCAFAHNTECIRDDYEERRIETFAGSSIDLKYEYCKYPTNELMRFDGYQLLNIKMNNQFYTYSNKVSGNGYFGGKMFYSQLGVFGFIEATTGNSPLTITYLTLIDDTLVLLGKVTFQQQMGNIIGDPYIEDKNNRTNELIKKILVANKQYIFGEYAMNYYESLLFILLDKIEQHITKNEIKKWLSRLLVYPDIVNYYRQKLFFKNSSLCTYNEKTIEMDAFGCQINNKQLSICYNFFNKSDLLYRYGSRNKIELELNKEINKGEILTTPLIFNKDIWQYEVNTDSTNAGILVKKNGKRIAFLKCDNDTIEPFLFSPIWK